jgi:ADP-ribosyl-[dinitrogen reductase] hydrolase
MSRLPLTEVIAMVEEEGARLRAEFYLARGPRGERGSAPIDREIEKRLRAKLQALIPCTFCGEECETVTGAQEGWTWLVDPHDGTFEYTQGRRGSAISVALLRGNVPVLGVVHSPDSPDRGLDTIAWAEGGPIVRNGRPVASDLSRSRLEAGSIVLATASSALRPETWSRAVFPARYAALPSIAYRLARVAAGDAVATLSIHPLAEYDIAAGLALIKAAGGVMLDAEGREVVLAGNSTARLSGCFAGAPQAAQQLSWFDWKKLEDEPRRAVRVALGFPRNFLDPVARAQGCLLAQVIGDNLGARVEGKTGAEIALLYPDGVRELADGGPYHLVAGQPTDDSEMALVLARSILRERKYDRDKALDAYRDWLTTRPVDVGQTTEQGLLGLLSTGSESNGSLMRVSPLGIWAAGDPALAARTARDDSTLTHPNEVCVEACAGFAAAIAAGIAGASRKEMTEAALAHAKGPARDAIERGAGGEPPADFFTHPGWVLVALQNAFFRLLNPSLQVALIQTVGAGGDTDGNAAIAGALLGAAGGREAIPPRWLMTVLACRALPEAGALRPRPIECWPDDALEVAEALLMARSS